VLAFVFWAVKFAIGLAFGMATQASVSQLLLGIAALVFIVWLIVWIVRWPLRFMRGRSGFEVMILRKRYARGEISDAQFKRMMKNLRDSERR
jgi:uncharacterized membrane protein